MAVLQTDLILNDKGFTAGIAKAQTALQKLPNASNQATQSLMNLSRVAQDAPYGFIGIANNINPLLESFQRLKATTGTTGGAFKELGKSLIGPAGIGLAVGVVSSLLVTFGDRLFGSGKAAKEAKEANDKLADSFSKEIVQLTSLVAVIKNSNSSQEDRRKALQAINEQYGKYLPSLNNEKVTLDNISQSYNKITDSLLRQAVVKGLQEEIEKSVKETASQLIALEKTEALRRQKFEEDTKRTREQVRAQTSLEEKLGRFNNTVKDGTLALRGQTDEFTKNLGAVNNYEATYARLQDQLKRQLEPLFGLMSSFKFDDLDVSLKNLFKNTSNGIKEVISDMLTLDQLLNRVSNAPKQGPINDAIERYFSGKPLNFDTFSNPDKFKNGSPGVKAPKGLIPPEVVKATDEQLQFIARTVGNVLQPAFAGLFDALEEGGDVVKSFFDGFIDGIKRMIEQLLATAAISGILALITGGSFNSIFSGAIGLSPKKRAAGGPVSGGLPYLVGENAPELFVPSTSGRIVPMNNLGGITGGAMQMIMVSGTFRQSGRDLVAVVSSENRYQRRNG